MKDFLSRLPIGFPILLGLSFRAVGQKAFQAALAVLLLASASFAHAQDYLFSVPEAQMLASVQQDGSIQITYEIHFKNAPGRPPIDVVDIGTPNDQHDLSGVRAWIDGRQLHDIRVSQYVSPGFEVHLDSGAIPPGGSGLLKVEFTAPSMVFQDTTRKDYASLRITPTWFGDPYVRGTTNLLVAIQLPKGVEPDSVLHQGLIFSKKAATPNGALVGWTFQDTRFTGRHDVGLSFPRGEVRVIAMTRIDLLLKWFRESPNARINLGIFCVLLFAFVYFRFTGGTGFSVFAILSAVACALFYYSPGWHLLSLPILAGLLALNEWFLDHRKLGYMPPIAQVEGGGIKRGLTAPEAAVLLELPIAKALSLVVFGMLKKGVVRQTLADPLTVEIDEALRLESDPPGVDQPQQAAACREAATKRGVVMHNYELPFLFLIQKNPSKPVREIDFAVPMKKLIEDTAARMKGFDLSETKAYYQSIVRQAMQQAAAIGDIEQRQKTIDRNFEWILMDEGYPTVFGNRPYRPVWNRGSMFPVGGGAASAPDIPGQTTFGDVTASFAGWTEHTMDSLASSISPGSLNLPKASGGFLDLSGADHITGEFFKALAEASTSGGGGGGGGGGCACACAGCACACACAGGGR